MIENFRYNDNINKGIALELVKKRKYPFPLTLTFAYRHKISFGNMKEPTDYITILGRDYEDLKKNLEFLDNKFHLISLETYDRK